MVYSNTNDFLETFISKDKFTGINSTDINKIDYDKIFLLKGIPYIIYKKICDGKINEFLNKVWSINEIPIVFIETKNDFRIYNSHFFEKNKFAGETYNNKEDFFQKIHYDDFFSGKIFENDIFLKKKKITSYLLENLKILVEELDNTTKEKDFVNNFLLKCLFTKCFSDRNLIKKIDFKNKKNLFGIFLEMDKKYNGDLFKLNTEKNKITEKNLEIVSNFFEGYDLKTKQKVLISPYNFSLIPIEIISEIYQNLLGQIGQNKNKSYYTPEFLANHILNKINFEKENTILDPSCGSSIFLVKYFKEKIKNLKKYKDIIKIIKNDIFGIDIDKNALKISCFSFYVLILDNIEISEIKNFKFPNLIDKNLINMDFFDKNIEKKINKKFDIIIGNPPWGNISNQQNYKKYSEQNTLQISNNNEISEAFIFKCGKFIKENKEIILLTKSLIFYSNKKIRKNFVNKFNLIEIEDFSRIRKNIFKNAISPFILIRYKLKTKDINFFNFKIFKNNIFFKNLKSLYLDNLDIKNINQNLLSNEKFNLQIFMDGDERDFFFLNRFVKNNPIKKIIKINGVGIQIKGGDKNPFHQKLMEFPLLQKKNFEKYFNNGDLNNIKKIKEVNDNKNEFHRIRKEELFIGKRLLFQKGNFKSELENRNLCFTNAIFVFKTFKENELNFLYYLFNSSFFKYYFFLNSRKWGIERTELRKEELLNFPLPNTEDFSDFDNLSENDKNKKINKIYKISNEEFDIIKYINELIIPYWEGNGYKKEEKKEKVFKGNLEKYLNNGENNILRDYIENFFNSILYSFKIGKLNAEIFNINKFIAIKFYYKKTEKRKIKLSEKSILKNYLNKLGNLSFNKIEKDVFLRKDIILYDKKSFTIIKLNLKKYWHKKIFFNDINKIIKYIKDE